MATPGNSRAAGVKDGTTKGIVADQIAQAVNSTSNLLRLMQQSSPSQAQLMKLPRNLMAKASASKNTGEVLQELPQVISSLDAQIESGLQSVSHLKPVTQLLGNMESTQLRPLAQARQSSSGV